MISDRPKAIAWRLMVAVLAIASLPAVPYFAGIEPFNPRHWQAVFRYVFAYGVPDELVRDFALSGGVWLAGVFVAFVACPWSAKPPSPLGSSAVARPSEWRRWKNPRVTARRGIVLGRVGSRVLMSDEPLSTALVAPAGTGKSVGTIIPSILASDDASLFVNDPKGELYEATAGHRAKIGRVIRIDYQAGAAGSACFNPIDPAVLPESDSDRCDLLDQLVNILLPYEGGNKFWTDAPQMGFSACLAFHVYDCIRRGEMPTLRGVREWISRLGEPPAGDDEVFDPVGYNLRKAAGVAEIEGYPARIAMGLREFADTHHETRSNIIVSFNAALRVLLNDKVAEVTSRTDFQLDELRGVGGRPVTIYVVVPALEQERYGKLTALLVESAVRYLTRSMPGKRELPVRFILDEAGFLTRIGAVAMGPAITRGYRVSFLLGFQNWGQVDAWGRGALESLKTNTAFKIVLTQNDQRTAEDISRMIGNFTRVRTSKSRQTGSGLFGRSSVSESEESVPLFRPEDLMSLPFGRQLVLVQGHANRPILCRSGYKTMKARAKLKPPGLKAA
jgi:type IV secretion system protein VirD4